MKNINRQKVYFSKTIKTDENWVSMKDIHRCDLVFKEIYGKYERKNLTDNDIKKYKMTKK